MSLLRGPDPLNHQTFLNHMLARGVPLHFMQQLTQQPQQQGSSSGVGGGSPGFGMNVTAFTPGLTLPLSVIQQPPHPQQHPPALAAQAPSQQLVGVSGTGVSGSNLQVGPLRQLNGEQYLWTKYSHMFGLLYC